MGYVDEKGYLYLTDRSAFMIISGGVNIYPQEIEDELALHPSVHDVAVIGVPDDDLGEGRRRVFVQPAPGHHAGDALADEIREHLAGRLRALQAPAADRLRRRAPPHTHGQVGQGRPDR